MLWVKLEFSIQPLTVLPYTTIMGMLQTTNLEIIEAAHLDV